MSVWTLALVVSSAQAVDLEAVDEDVRLTLYAAAVLSEPTVKAVGRVRGLSEAEVGEHLQVAADAGWEVTTAGSTVVLDPTLEAELDAAVLPGTREQWRRAADRMYVATSAGVFWVVPKVAAEVWGARRRFAVGVDLGGLVLPGPDQTVQTLFLPQLTLRRMIGEGRWTGDAGLSGGVAVDASPVFGRGTTPLAYLDLGLRWHAKIDAPHPFVRLGAGFGGAVVTGFEGGLYPLPVVSLALGWQN